MKGAKTYPNCLLVFPQQDGSKLPLREGVGPRPWVDLKATESREVHGLHKHSGTQMTACWPHRL